MLMGPDGALDEIVAVGGDGCLDLHLHGGAGVESALLDLLEREGWARRDDRDLQPEPTSLRAATAWASSRWGHLARLDTEVRRLLADEHASDAVPSPDVARQVQQSLDLELHARRLVTPAVVRLVGKPNAGKSTLANALLGDQRALVSPRPGTTRDTVRSVLAVAGVPIVIEDTAGQWEPDEQAGLRRHSAPDLIVHLLSDPRETRLEGPDVLVVLGRADLHPQAEGPAVSGTTGAGLERLLERIRGRLGIQTDESVDGLSPVDQGMLQRLGSICGRMHLN
jgi:hypothetical protein